MKIIKFYFSFQVDPLEDVDEDEEDRGLERSCDTLIMCIITTLNNGLRNGGGIGDVLRKPSMAVRIIEKIN